MDDLSLLPNDEQPAAERTNQMPRARISRAIRLLERLIAEEMASAEGLARALGISSQQLEEYRTGFARIPLQLQRRLADLVITSVPELLREGRRLELQCKAEEAFHAKETETHMVAPPGRFR